MHRRGLVPLDKERLVAIAGEEAFQLGIVHARKHRRIGDLVAVEVQHRQHRAVCPRVEELVRVPRRRQRPGLGLAVAHPAGNDEIGVVEGRAIGVDERVAELAAFVDRARRLWRHMARYPARKGELPEQRFHALDVSADMRIHLAVGALQPRVGDHGRDRR